MQLGRLTAAFEKLLSRGFFHLVGLGTINKIITTVLNIVLVRLLSKYDYGIYSYAYNIASYFIIFNGLGATSAALQLCSEYFASEDRSERFFRYSYIVSGIVDVVFLLLILATSCFGQLAIPDAAPLLALYCAYPLLQQLCDIKTTYLRIELDNAGYAVATNIQTVLLCIFSIAGAFVFDAAGLVVGQNIALLLTYIWLCRKHPFNLLNGCLAALDKSDQRQYWEIAIISAFNNGISQALTLVGTTLVGILLLSEIDVSTYKVATTIPFALLFFPSSIITFVYPYFVRNKDNRQWTLRNYGLLTLSCVVIMGVITAVFIAFAEPVVSLVFGTQYLDAVPTFRVLLIGFFFTASFRTPTGNLLVTQRRLITNTVIGIASIILCVIGSYVLIPSFGLIGAAIVYDLCMIFGSVFTVLDYLRVTSCL